MIWMRKLTILVKVGLDNYYIICKCILDEIAVRYCVSTEHWDIATYSRVLKFVFLSKGIQVENMI